MTVSTRVKNEGQSSVLTSLRITVQERVYKDGVLTELWKDVETLSLASMEDLASYVTASRRLVIEEGTRGDVKRVVLTDAVEVKDA